MKDTIFSPAFGNKPRTMVGRDSDMKTLQDGLASVPGSKERAVLIIGQRGMGKTVMLLELADYARNHGYIVASPTVVSRGMRDRILEKLETDGEDYLVEKTPRITGGTIGAMGVTAGIQMQTQQKPPRSFGYRLGEYCSKAKAHNKGILILVDEVQANNDELKDLIIAYQERVGADDDIAVVFAGLPAAIAGTLNEHVLTFLNRAFKMELGPIPAAEIEIYYRNSFTELGIVMPDEWVQRAAEVSEGSPYMMQLIGHYITVSASDSGELPEEDFLRALQYARKDFTNDICRTTLASLSEVDIDFLRAMTPDKVHSSVKDVAERLNVGSAYVQRYKTRLIEAGVIVSDQRGYVAFAVPYLNDYLREQVESFG